MGDLLFIVLSLLFYVILFGLILSKKITTLKVIYLIPYILLSLVIWPFPSSSEEEVRFLGLPLDYLPVLGVMFGFILSSIFDGTLRIKNIPRFPLIIAIIFILYLVLSSFWVLSISLLSIRILLFSFYFMYVFSMIAYFKSRNQEISKFIEKMTFFIALFVLIGMFRYYILSIEGRHEGDYSTLIYYRSSEVMIILSVIPITLGKYLAIGSKKYFILFFLLSVGLIGTYSRTSFVGYSILFFLSLLMMTKKTSLKKISVHKIKLVIGILVILLTITPFILNTSLGERMMSLDMAQKIYVEGGIDSHELGGKREHMQLIALAMFLNNPLLGVGIGNYSVAVLLETNDEYLTSRSHNFYLSYLAELGMIGFMIFYVFIIYIALIILRKRHFVNNIKEKYIVIGLGITQLTIMAMMVSQEFVSAPYIWLFWGFSLAYTFSLRRE